MVECLLCKSKQLQLFEVIDSKSINELYENRFNIKSPLESGQIKFYSCKECGLKFFHPIEPGGEELYEELQKHDWYYLKDKPEFHLVLSYLEEAEDILEVGAGAGDFANYVGGERYFGLEFNEDAIVKAKKNGIKLLKESIQTHASKGNKYDAVVSFQVLEHVPDPRAFLRSCIKCLKPNGKLIVAVPSHNGFVGLTTNNILDMPPHHTIHWSKESLKSVSTIFDIDCIDISHEDVASFHQVWARHTILLDKLKNIFKVEHKLLDQSLKHKVLSKIAGFLRRIIKIPLDNVPGHTIIAVYRKK